MPILRMTDLDLAGQRVLVREDLNVPIDDGRITSELRIEAALPTLRRLLDQGAAVMVMSHLGRPKEGTWSEADSLAPVARRLGELLDREVALVRDYLDGVDVAPGQLVLLENCRMNVGEKADDVALAARYAALCDVFVMDAFGTAHRAQASTHGVIRKAAVACGGPLLMNELDRPREAASAFARAEALAPRGNLAEDAVAREVEAWRSYGQALIDFRFATGTLVPTRDDPAPPSLATLTTFPFGPDARR